MCNETKQNKINNSQVTFSSFINNDKLTIDNKYIDIVIDNQNTFFCTDLNFDSEFILNDKGISLEINYNDEYVLDMLPIYNSKNHKHISIAYELDLDKNEEQWNLSTKEINNISKIDSYTFINCIFTKKVQFSVNIKDLNFINCIFHDRCYINNQYHHNETNQNNKRITIDSLKITNTTFKNNFKLHNCLISNFEINDTDFIKNADFFKTEFISGSLGKKDIYFKAINFHELALFGNTTFHEYLKFKYVTFKGYSHFRSSIFCKGLDLDYSNIQEEMNFFGAKDLETKYSKENTSQETYRIIKHNFEKIGNKIEANKYFALELEQKKLNIKKEKPLRLFDYIVFQTNWLSSEFGTNWIRVLLLICSIGLITVGIVNFEIFKEVFFNPSLFKLEYIGKVLNEWSQYVYILDKSSKLASIPILFLLNKVFLGYLYYQLVISIRKDTHR